MNRAVKQVNTMRVLGAMSGTSLDGVDAAVIETDGTRVLGFGPTAYRAYSDTEREVLRAALGQWRGDAVVAAAHVVEAAHLDLLAEFEPVDLIGFHGQTVAHAPRAQGTLQIGDGARLAQRLNTKVVWDFRGSDVGMGGEGAPLAPFYHFACAKWMEATSPLVFLNLGGVGNLTYVDPSFDGPEQAGALMAFDTGPANAPVNDLVQARRGLAFDKDGEIAAGGQVEQGALERFLAEPYFAKVPPKSLDRNDFDEMITLVNELNDQDAAATLTAMCAAGVVEAMRHCPSPPARVLVTGGGRHNPVLMKMLEMSLDCPVVPVESAGLDGDMLEAQAFAFLAARVVNGLSTSGPDTTGVREAVCGGVVSAPA